MTIKVQKGRRFSNKPICTTRHKEKGRVSDTVQPFATLFSLLFWLECIKFQPAKACSNIKGEGKALWGNSNEVVTQSNLICAE